MAIRLIGLHRTWAGRQISLAQRERFAAALGLANGRPGQTSFDGETLLASTGQSRGWQPETAPDGTRVLFAGHIANRRGLSNELSIAQTSDAALYAAGYAAWGDAIDLKAIGQFATIVTHPDHQEVRLARSPIVAPPLFYWHDGGTMIATSLIGAMFATGEIERRLDYTRIAGECIGNPVAPDRSNFLGIKKVLCGQRARFSQNEIAFETYYDLDALPEIRLKNDRDYVEQATALLTEGIRAALDGFARPAVSVSGGLDSQAVAAIAARLRPGETLEAFTCVPEQGWDGTIVPERFGDERPYVEALAAMYPEIRPHWIDAAEHDLDYKRPSIFMAAGDPGPPTLGHFTHDVYAKAKACGCDVILEAVYGNDTFSYTGSGTLPALARRGRWIRLWREARHLSRSQPHSAIRIIATQAVLPLAPAWLRDGLARLAGRGDLLDIDPFETWCVLRRDYVEKLIAEQAIGPVKKVSPTRLPASSRQYRVDHLDTNRGDFAETRQAFDIIYGVETRDPTSYRPLVEFCLGIPDDQYLRDGQSRWLARRMLQGLVPHIVASETRKGMRVADWHQRIARQRSKMIADYDRLLEDDAIAGMIDIASLRQALIDWPETPPAFLQDWRIRTAAVDGQTLAQFIKFYENRNQ